MEETERNICTQRVDFNKNFTISISWLWWMRHSSDSGKTDQSQPQSDFMLLNDSILGLYKSRTYPDEMSWWLVWFTTAITSIKAAIPIWERGERCCLAVREEHWGQRFYHLLSFSIWTLTTTTTNKPKADVYLLCIPPQNQMYVVHWVRCM